jgi:enamine deaminase RidA (YjgF/YER057c/UK114 family)
MSIERIRPAGLIDLPHFTPVIKTGSLVVISGQIALDAEGNVVGRGDAKAQTARVFANLEIALKAAGASLADLVKLTIYATDRAYLQDIRDVRRTFLGTPDPVTSTFVVVSGLALPELLVEIEAMAVVGDDHRDQHASER